MEVNAWEHLVSGISGLITKMPALLVTVILIWLLSRLAVRIAFSAGALTKTDRKVLSLIISSIKFAAWVIGLAAVTNALGLTQLSLALGGSIALVGAALATGLNTIPQDLLAGIFLIGDREFAAGRKVKAANVEGTLEEITVRKTRIRDAEGNLHTVPNRLIDQNTYTVYREQKR